MTAIINYGMGNVLSVKKALDSIQVKNIITENRAEIASCSHIILPGVGSFRQAMENLHAKDLVDILQNEVMDKEKPFLGICLGMQLLADNGFEDEETTGLGFIKGSVIKIPDTNLPSTHIGWNDVEIKDNSFFRDITDRNFYFVHSFFLNPLDENDIAATVTYGSTLTAAVHRGNVFGTQFHPEKSQVEGLKILKNFIGSC